MPSPIRQLLSQTSYVADGTNTVWDISFPYIAPAHVQANYLLAGVTTPVTLSFQGTAQVVISPPVPAGAVLTIFRDTPKSAPLVNFADKGYLNFPTLDTNARQAIYAAAEAQDGRLLLQFDAATAGSAAGTAAGSAAALAFSNGRVAAQRNGLDVTVKGVIPDSGLDQTAGFNAALLQGIADNVGPITVPMGAYGIAKEITVDRGGLVGKHSSRSAFVFLSPGSDPGDGSQDYGINLKGQGLGGSSTDGAEIGNINLQGKKRKALLRLHGTGDFYAHDIHAQNIQDTQVIRITESQDSAIERVNIFIGGRKFYDDGVTPYPAKDGAVAYVGPTSNNIHFIIFRQESPRGVGLYVDGASSVTVEAGKIDGGSATADILTTRAFVVVDSGDATFRKFLLTGYRSAPLEVIGSGVLDYEGRIQNGQSDCLVKSTSAAYVLGVLFGLSPGVIPKPYVRMRGIVNLGSINNPANVTPAIMSLLAPDNFVKPAAGNDGRVTVAGAFVVEPGVYQASLTDWNGTAYAAPTLNDRYTGCFLVNSVTGAALAIVTLQAGALIRFRLLPGAAVPNGMCFAKFDDVDGVRVDIQLTAVNYGSARVTTRLAALSRTVTRTSAVGTFVSATGLTTVAVSDTLVANAHAQMFVWDKVNDLYYLIVSNTTNSLTLAYDRTATVLASTAYDIVIGNPKAGPGTSLTWV